MRIGVTVANAGGCAGDEVVQLYVHDAAASVTRPVKELKGFKRVELEPGQQKTVSFELAVSQLGFYDRGMQFTVEPGTIEVMIGSSSADIRLQSAFEIIGEPADLRLIRRYSTPVRAE